MNWLLILDLVMVALLAATVVSAVVLYRRLGRLRRAQDDMRALTDALSASVQRAEDGVGHLRISAETLKADVSQADEIVADLHDLVERASAAADRLEASIRQTRSQQPATTVAPSVEPTAAKAGEDAGRSMGVDSDADAIPARSRSERALIDALRLAD
jgi:biopolymer transport protein ExbB/TolQ